MDNNEVSNVVFKGERVNLKVTWIHHLLCDNYFLCISAEEEFNDLCFEFGLELDEVVSLKLVNFMGTLNDFRLQKTDEL